MGRTYYDSKVAFTKGVSDARQRHAEDAEDELWEIPESLQSTLGADRKEDLGQAADCLERCDGRRSSDSELSGLTLQDVPRDGNCLYHAVGAALGRGNDDGKAVRNELLNYIINDETHPMYEAEEWASIKERVKTNGEWGECQEIGLLAEMTDRLIAVHTPKVVKYFMPGGLGMVLVQSAEATILKQPHDQQRKTRERGWIGADGHSGTEEAQA